MCFLLYSFFDWCWLLCHCNLQPVPDPMPDMKETIEAVLDSCGMSGKRANKLTQDDLLT